MSTRLKLLEAFQGREDSLVSGADLARQLKLTRGAVWKHMMALRDMGFPIESQDRAGYRFEGIADFSLARFSSNAPVTPHYALVSSSTQTTARQAAEAGLPAGHLWLSEIQTSGRGRLERKWDSHFGGLWFSMLLRPSVPLADVAPLAMEAARIIAKMLKEKCGIPGRVKWPNDVVVHVKGKRLKIAGILTEMTGEADRTRWVVLGVGLNVNNLLPASLSPIATSIRELTGRSWNRAEILEAFLKRFAKSKAFLVKSRRKN